MLFRSWRNEFEFSAWGEEGYSIAHGRGGHYGALKFRSGQRWGWQRAESQGSSEEVVDFGALDNSFAIETERVVRTWLGMPDGEHSVATPATPAEALRATELAERSALLGAQRKGSPHNTDQTRATSR